MKSLRSTAAAAFFTAALAFTGTPSSADEVATVPSGTTSTSQVGHGLCCDQTPHTSPPRGLAAFDAGISP